MFVLHIDDGLPHAEQVAAFKTENGVKRPVVIAGFGVEPPMACGLKV